MRINYRKFIEENFDILDKDTLVPTDFKFNPVQSKYYDILTTTHPEMEGVREIVLKARQEGMCLDGKTKVLTSDLRWVPVSTIKKGDGLVSVDEFPDKGRGKGRKMRKALVEGINIVKKQAFKLVMDDGRELIATAEHRFLSHKRGGSDTIWKEVGGMKVGDEIRSIVKPWDGVTLEDAWFSGIVDGEGTLRRKERAGCELSICQVEGFVWQRLIDYAERSGMTYRIDWDIRTPEDSGKLGNAPVGRLVFGRMNEIFELIGKTRPVRMITKEWWEGKDLPGKKSGIAWSKIISITPLGVQKMYDIQTSQKTFIAEGFVSHNSSFILALFAVDFLLRPYSVSICISHRKDSTDILFKKVKSYLDSYFKILAKKQGVEPEAVQKQFLKSDNRNLLENAQNNAMFYIGTAGSKVGGRGGTARNLLFSECAFYQDTELITAREIVVATAQQVPQGRGMIFIESTANGVGNYYQEEWERAHQFDDKGERISAYHPQFFGWDEFYTEEWVNQKKKDFPNDRMWKQEYPKDADEAFISSGEPYFNITLLKKMLDERKEPIWKGKYAPDGEYI